MAGTIYFNTVWGGGTVSIYHDGERLGVVDTTTKSDDGHYSRRDSLLVWSELTAIMKSRREHLEKTLKEVGTNASC